MCQVGVFCFLLHLTHQYVKLVDTLKRVVCEVHECIELILTLLDLANVPLQGLDLTQSFSVLLRLREVLQSNLLALQ